MILSLSRENSRKAWRILPELCWQCNSLLQGFIRFSKEGGAQRAIDALKEANDGKILIRDVETTLRVLEGVILFIWSKAGAQTLDLSQIFGALPVELI